MTQVVRQCRKRKAKLDGSCTCARTHMQSPSLRQFISNRVQNYVVTTIVQTKDPCRSVIVVNNLLVDECIALWVSGSKPSLPAVAQKAVLEVMKQQKNRPA